MTKRCPGHCIFSWLSAVPDNAFFLDSALSRTMHFVLTASKSNLNLCINIMLVTTRADATVYVGPAFVFIFFLAQKPDKYRCIFSNPDTVGLIFIQSFRLWLGQYNDESSCPGQDKALLKINILFLLPFVSHLFNLTKFTLCVREKIPFFCIQLLFKGGVSRDFLPQFFFINWTRLGPW